AVREMEVMTTSTSLSASAVPAEPEEAAGDGADLDLLRALGDPVAAVVAVDVLERLGAAVADPAVDLDGAVLQRDLLALDEGVEVVEQPAERRREPAPAQRRPRAALSSASRASAARRRTRSPAGTSSARGYAWPAQRLIASASPRSRAAARTGAVTWCSSGYAIGAPVCSRMKRLVMPRARRPVNARVSAVGASPPSA